MADIRCPMCGKNNPEELEICRFCGARLKPLRPSTPAELSSIKPGEKPTQKDTSEFEKVKLPGPETIKPGQAPTKKSTAELERALPSWLRSLRGSDDGGNGHESEPAEEQAGESLPLPGKTPAESNDLLFGLNQAASDDDEAVPDWLAGLRAKKTSEPEKPAEAESRPEEGLGNVDWLSRLESEPQKQEEAPTVETPPEQAPAQPAEETPDWLKLLRQNEEPKPQPPAEAAHLPEPSGEPAARSELPDWLSALQQKNAEAMPPAEEPESASPAGTGESASFDNLPDWLNRLQDTGAPAEPTPGAEKAESLPDWLSSLPSGGTSEGTSTEKAPDWLSGLEEKAPAPEEPPAAAPAEKVPDWLSGSDEKTAAPEEPATAPAENVPDWLSGLQEKAAAAEEPSAAPAEAMPDWLSGLQDKALPEETPAQPEENLPDWLSSFKEETPAAAAPVEAGQPQEPAPAEAPDWLSRLEAETPVLETPAQPQKEEALPDWLKSAEESAPAKTPAFTEENAVPAEPVAAFTETPDWLSKVKPEEEAEKAPAAEEEEQPVPANLEAAALPSWVQAMRPVESVVAEKAGVPAEEQVTEHSGPLAGLAGVLPAGPGLGTLRKPPTYSIKLQLSETHQRYVGFFDRLIGEETKARPAKAAHVASHFWWRLTISIILLAAIALPFLANAPFSPASTLASGDTAFSSTGNAKGATTQVIEALGTGAPVLMVFDYEPGLSSELEAVAAPLVDQLMNKNVRLTVLSTSPTGPALAEQFLQTAPLVNTHGYKSGTGYLNLGYLAGGPAGIAAFAAAPSSIMPYTTGGKAAWSEAPLQGVTRLSDFSAVFVLTDNADSGRDWVEQAGGALGSTPMVMVTSAQAEPMVRPYFDSGQLKGLVAGLLDGKIYEQSFNRHGLAYHYWDSYSLGVLAAGILIIVGAAWSALSNARRRPSEEV